MDESLKLLLQQIISGQNDIYARLTKIETHMAEKRGERRLAVWLVGAGSSTFGAALYTLGSKLFGHKAP